eukprot:CAMPEP_0201527240 /NCGR_PEP_ID=MMETSP0161_2-20130828/34530_1 /ASSEMBLY_ACC=CAM_ASM_000251 /TAXON_ID=180227 /ORGANISM="Neoparamoeba aestuarina, Strain SoJaBio B1-5/56/2" /LENGTH=141 /DNA_ID=CAMNT_0047927991 /DNA_START=57 /DNA_END=479 /DNA_ORIENTATION=-
MEKEKLEELVVAEFKNLVEKKQVEPPLAAVQVVAELMKRSEASTMMEFQIELDTSIKVLKSLPDQPISVSSACELLEHFVIRSIPTEYKVFEDCKAVVIERGSQYAKRTDTSFQKISSLTEKFVRHNATILVHGGIAPVQA